MKKRQGNIDLYIEKGGGGLRKRFWKKKNPQKGEKEVESR